ncbi:TetR/AcrR family transcriptional regulator [Streptomyces sp. NPDC048566]|uniref:TetR/AcrR family transcriptional regulator n=1 Tax=Streptomyces sp. NPDC048566 TaxID=3365569 RepID=UPI00372115CF
MPRPADLAKRRALVDGVREYMIHNGLADLSLRPLARALGTSDRMLLYYFGTKERMVTEVLALDERRPLRHARDLLARAGSPRDPARIRRFLELVWQGFDRPDLRAALPLYLEILAAGLLRSDRYGPVMRTILAEWTALLRQAFRDLGMAEARAAAEADVLVDACLGLLVAPLADGRWDRADAAFRTLLDRLEPGWRGA